jgi:hypothetical protein
VLAWLRPHLRRVEDLAAQLAIMADGLLIGPARRPAAAALLFDLVLPTGACTAPQLGNALHAVLATTCGEPVDRARHQRMLRHALAFGAGDASVQFNAACLCMELGERTKAVEHLAAALRLGADPAHLHAEPLVRGLATEALVVQAQRGARRPASRARGFITHAAPRRA